MTQYRHLAIAAMLLVAGCAYNSRERVDQSVGALTCHPYDQQPPAPAVSPAGYASRRARRACQARSERRGFRTCRVRGRTCRPSPGWSLDSRPTSRRLARQRLDLNIPPEIPGSEARRLELPKEPAAKQREIERLFPELPPLPAEPIPVPGPNGQALYLGRLAADRRRQQPATSASRRDVEAARGNMIQANAYPNPTVSYQIHAVEQRQHAGGRRLWRRPDDQDRRKARACKRPRPRWLCTTPNWPCGGPAAIWPPRSATPTSPSWWPRRRSG